MKKNDNDRIELPGLTWVRHAIIIIVIIKLLNGCGLSLL